MEIDIWNIQESTNNYAGSQEIFNIVGRIYNSDAINQVTYSINGCESRPVFFNSEDSSSLRLVNKGEFNIDTIKVAELNANNTLTITASLNNGQRYSRQYSFPAYFERSIKCRFNLDLDKIQRPQEVGQIIDGRWRVSYDEVGRRCLEISEKDAGYDRIILFSDKDLTEGYKIHARMRVNKWLATNKLAGLVFKWNPHLIGDGTWLPTQWTTGLAYYYSGCDGLLLRYGIDVHQDSKGEKVGDNILAKAKISKFRHRLNLLATKILRKRDLFPQIVLGQLYDFCLELSADHYSFTVWPSNRKKPSPQIYYPKTPPLIKRGACGIIGYYCNLQVYNFAIDPIG